TWTNLYESISSANCALKGLNGLSEAEFALTNIRMGEMRFLRGHSHFIAKVMSTHIPYIDATMTREDSLTVSNHDLTSDQLWDKIAEDFQFAIDNLPVDQPEVGRANKIAAMAYLAKVRLYQAYEQDDNHNVIAINPTRLNEVVDLTGEVINSG